MNINTQQISGVPTNIITGFLGTGKTSAILNLLKSKPTHEKWAVLINEFGEIGVDGSLFEGQHNEEQGVYIREVPGGCMCCAAGLPMQIALNLLLVRARPQRLLIEPTGLGHPIEVLEALSAEHYNQTLSIQKVLTLVDARKLTDSRYTEHATFNQQIAIADVLVGNKQDLYQPEDKAILQAYAQEHGSASVQVIFAENGEIDPIWLAGATAAKVKRAHHHAKLQKPSLYEQPPIPESGFIRAVNQGEGFHSIGWRITPNKTFDRIKLLTFFNGLTVERMKAVFITENGVFGYNLTTDGLTELELDDCLESRIEIIATRIDEVWEKNLKECIVESIT